MIVSIDQQLCTGDGVCEQGCPQLFALGDDGYAYVKDAEGELVERTTVPAGLELAAIQAAEECPGECIVVDAA